MVFAAVVSRVTIVTSVHRGTSTTRSVNSVVAARSALSLKAAMLLVVASADPSFRVLDVSSADLDFILTPTVKCAAVILAPHWTAAAPRQVTATAGPITAGCLVTSAHLVTMDTPAAHPVSAPLKAPATAAATR